MADTQSVVGYRSFFNTFVVDHFSSYPTSRINIKRLVISKNKTVGIVAVEML